VTTETFTPESGLLGLLCFAAGCLRVAAGAVGATPTGPTGLVTGAVAPGVVVRVEGRRVVRLPREVLCLVGACEPPPVVVGVVTGVGELPPCGVLELDGLVVAPLAGMVGVVGVCGTPLLSPFLWVKFEPPLPFPCPCPLFERVSGFSSSLLPDLPLFTFCVKPPEPLPPLPGDLTAGA
jgi:hypothetical protein